MGGVVLRRVQAQDLEQLFDHQLDPEANRMAGFVREHPYDLPTWIERWNRHLADPEIIARTITVDDEVVGSISSYPGPDGPEVTYWIDRAQWGHGIASRALAAFLDEVDIRPLHARVAADNLGSLTVLQRSGFTVVGQDRGYAPGRGEDIDEYLLTLPD